MPTLDPCTDMPGTAGMSVLLRCITVDDLEFEERALNLRRCLRHRFMWLVVDV